MASISYDQATVQYPGAERPSVDALELEIADGTIRQRAPAAITRPGSAAAAHPGLRPRDHPLIRGRSSG